MSKSARVQFKRFKEIHELVLRYCPKYDEPKYLSAKNISSQLGVAAETVRRDIRFMRDEMGLPFEYDQEDYGWILTGVQKYFTIIAGNTSEDLVALLLAMKALEALPHTPLAMSLNCEFNRVTDTLRERITLSRFPFDQAVSVIEPGTVPVNVLQFERIVDAVLGSYEIHFDYLKFKAKEKEHRRMQPYHLAWREGCWYIIGIDVAKKEVRNFALQRMTGLQTSKKAVFKRSDDFDLSKHLGNFGIWGNTREDGSNYQIQIRFTGYAAQLVSERHWHPSEKIKSVKKDNSVIELSLELGDLREITRWVLSWGGEAKVLAPGELKAAVEKEAQRILKNCSY